MEGRAVTDARDGVYSILGMAKDIDPAHWGVDYDKEAINVFLDTTENIIRATGRLDIICHSNWSDEHEHGCSWVLGFAGGFGECGREVFLTNSLTISEILLQNEGTMSEIITDISPYSASGSTKADVLFDRQARKLIAKGVIIDKVTKEEEALAFKSSNEAVSSAESQRVINFETFWRVTVANKNQVELELDELNIDPDDLSDFDDIFDHSESLFTLYREPAPEEWGKDCEEWLKGDLTGPDATTADFLKGLGAYVRSKRYIIMKNSMGLGPEATKEGGIVCTLLGCSIPVILRLSKTSPGEYHLAGEAYVHGLMDGEVMEKLDAGHCELQELAII
ncbi:uncharacterized protein PAC_15665 [Phialocephala subalpina]|uniref:Heterokaryon incompatibility domain-containing protein n=1 Tax=Phialocephala subalpina TaxID=576137 RepID=A0A1L7XL25_9HELO|nr:uncharacterized protein PAC_15665 [Phialocephala subalpina]